MADESMPSPPTLRPSVPDPELDRRRRAHVKRHRAMKWVKRGVLVAIAAAAAVAAVLAWLPDPVPVDLVTAVRADLEVTVEEDGLTRVRERYVVSAPLAGNLLRVELDPGDSLAAGAAVARVVPLDPALIDRRSRAETEARLNAAVARQRQANAGADRARAARDAAIHEAERARGLVRSGAASTMDLDRAELAERLAHADASAANLERVVAAAEVASVRAALGRMARGDREELLVTAPVAGRVLRLLRESEGPVAAGAPLIEVGDPRAMEAVIDVLSSDAARIRPGAPVAIEQWGGPVALTGRVRLVEPSAFTRISALGVEEQRVNVLVALDAPPPELGDGYRVEARIRVARVERALVVPAGAVFRDRQRWAVYAARDGRAVLLPIEIGERGGDLVEVTAGLSEGARVVLHPGDAVRDGVALAPR